MRFKRFQLNPWISIALTAALIVAAAATPSTRWTDYEDRIRATEAVLDRRLPEVRMDNVGLENALAFLQQASGLSFYIDWDHLATRNIHRNSPITCRLRNIPIRKALTIIIEGAGNITGSYPWEIDARGAVVIGGPPIVIERRYECRDLLALSIHEDRQALMNDIAKLITTTVAPETWEDAGGKVGRIRHEGGVLFIDQTRDHHRLIGNLMDNLRTTRLDTIGFMYQ